MPADVGSSGRRTPADAVVLVPTFNEAGSLPGLVARVLAAAPGVDIIVIDDASPDGTGDVAERLAGEDPRVSVLHRPMKDGLGRAYRAGFALALERRHRLIVQMDADGSHPADVLPRMLEIAAADPGADLVIGSRWVPGGRTVDWSPWRERLSRAANAYARRLLRIRVADVTAGYRVYRADVLRRLDLTTIRSQGYYFQVEMTVRVHDSGGSITEVPIEFRERAVGASKMSLRIIIEAMVRVTALGIRRRMQRRDRSQSR